MSFVPPEYVTWLLVVCAAAVGWASLARCRRYVRDTTLAAPWSWTLLSLTIVAGVELALAAPQAGSATWDEPLRFAAAMTTFCPFMALLGAKRPQDRAWQFIVLTLYLLLLLPCGEMLLFRPGEPLAMPALWSWLLLVLMGLGLLNYLPTRYWLAAIVACAAQANLAYEHLPFARWPRAEFHSLSVPMSLAGFALALLLVAAGMPRAARAAQSLDRLWIDFRDRFGAVWGLRVAERLRELSTRNAWGVSVSWTGIAPHDPREPLSEPVQEAVQQNCRALLLRFVSPAWIAERLDRA